MTNKEYKVVMIGAPKSGKTSLIKKLVGCEFDPLYLPTSDLEVRWVKFNTNYGEITLKFLDTPGGKGREHWSGSDCAIAVSDGENLLTDIIIEEYKSTVSSSVVLITNKLDNKPRFSEFDVSVKNDFNHNVLWRSILRTVTGKENLEILLKGEKRVRIRRPLVKYMIMV
jgi:small GTP-binding protein